ncbi:hypothetical protein P154DRAFT_107808 [Amniculicola lignicola CBS 123094]|uniref:Uncharacterized protein n=1 Tax=Amniculicola lignicola CBS 123094 TaxID=1392246 RepID=A0A6A5WMP8_9PLEO|nr:hypothetical protein P154DRAFT_107808 [Amniculicola lignicola CBS 123094]
MFLSWPPPITPKLLWHTICSPTQSRHFQIPLYRKKVPCQSKTFLVVLWPSPSLVLLTHPVLFVQHHAIAALFPQLLVRKALMRYFECFPQNIGSIMPL